MSSQLINEEGHRYSNLIVQSITKNKNNHAAWLCLCDCGNIKNVRSHSLLSGNTKSCGCLVSWGEQKITNFLIEKQISFKPQFSFKDLCGINKRVLRFDFGLLNESNLLIGLIEYQGDQHFSPIQEWGGEKKLKEVQNRDYLKKEYCQTHNIPLLLLTKEDNDFQEKILFFYNKCIKLKEEGES